VWLFLPFVLQMEICIYLSVDFRGQVARFVACLVRLNFTTCDFWCTAVRDAAVIIDSSNPAQLFISDSVLSFEFS